MEKYGIVETIALDPTGEPVCFEQRGGDAPLIFEIGMARSVDYAPVLSPLRRSFGEIGRAGKAGRIAASLPIDGRGSFRTWSKSRRFLCFARSIMEPLSLPCRAEKSTQC